MDDELVRGEVLGAKVTDGLGFALRRVAAIARRVAVGSLVVGLATFFTGTAVFDSGGGRAKWLVVGGALCAVPFLAAGLAAWRLSVAAVRAPQLREEVRRFTSRSGHSAEVLLDYDTGHPIGLTGVRMGLLRAELDERRSEYPFFSAAVRSLVTLPKLVAIVVFGTLGVGALGTLLLIGALID